MQYFMNLPFVCNVVAHAAEIHVVELSLTAGYSLHAICKIYMLNTYNEPAHLDLHCLSSSL